MQRAFDVLNANDNLSSISYDYLQLKLEDLRLHSSTKSSLSTKKNCFENNENRNEKIANLNKKSHENVPKSKKMKRIINTELARLQKLPFLRSEATNKNFRKRLMV